MWTTLFNILIFLLVLSLVICIHELGHFLFAKRAGILCHEFSFGMGPKLWSRKKGETTFSIRAIPFGGYVAMAGEEVEADILKPQQKIRIGLDQDGEINRIVLNPQHPHYQDFLEITIDDMDLQGVDGGRLYINEYTVKRDAFYVFDKKVMQIAPR
ncbi:MAG: site-2 protease family protein, partial [Candidatus Izemoplasmatales bacterium]|nr:site-2 protease family protein [Candidatus Izemoplasmatales bacterium]